MIRKKYAALRSYRKNKTEGRKLKLRGYCQQVKYAIRRKRKLYIEKIEASFRDNPKIFWKHHKAILNHRSALNPVITFNNRVAKSPKEKAELFNDYFCSVFGPATQSESCSETSTSWQVTPNQLTEITVTEEEIATYLSNVDPFKATGPDGIPGRILKECYRSKSLDAVQLFSSTRCLAY